MQNLHKPLKEFSSEVSSDYVSRKTGGIRSLFSFLFLGIFCHIFEKYSKPLCEDKPSFAISLSSSYISGSHWNFTIPSSLLKAQLICGDHRGWWGLGVDGQSM